MFCLLQLPDMKSFFLSTLLVLFLLPLTGSTDDIELLRRIASLRNELIPAGRAQLDGLSLADQKKAAGIISELLDRAEQKILGEIPESRFPWSMACLGEPAGIIDLAKAYLDQLAVGTDPFAGKFAEPGGYTVDHAIIKKGDFWHLVYIRGIAGTDWPEYPLSNFGHAVSRDLVNWEVRKPVLETVPGNVESYQVWAPHIIQHDGLYWIFYTGVNDSATQTICLATSPDLENWTRHERNPLFNSLPWGHWDDRQWSDCRDPMVLKAGDTFYCYYTAGRIIPENGEHEYCLGIATSKDLLNWKDEGFRTLVHSRSTPAESPFVVERNGEFYLFYTNYQHGIVYVKSPDPLHGWKEDPGDPHSIIPGVSASEIFREDGRWYISYISHMPDCLHFLEIKELVWSADGRVSVADFNGLGHE